jgi:DNA-3-methyladenine glycosylase
VFCLRSRALYLSPVLSDSFFQIDPLQCAENLIGTELVWGKCSGLIVETEAYLAEGDEASHTFKRPSTRAFIERNKAGAAYIYFNYGVHWMLNVLVKGGPRDGLILIRAIEPQRGIEVMRKRRGVEDVRRLCSGPGKLTQALAITKRHHEIDLCADPAHSFRVRPNEKIDVVADRRIGISRAQDFPWRFTLRGSPFVSIPPRPLPACHPEPGEARRGTSQGTCDTARRRAPARR